MRKLSGLALALSLAGTTANAALTITIQESGADVVATASGSLNIDGLVGPDTGNFSGALIYNAGTGRFLYSVGQSTPADSYEVNFTSAEQLFQLTAAFPATSNTGPAVGVDQVSALEQNLVVPPGYSSGDPITSSSTWSGQTLASLGLTPGDYLFDYDVDTVTFRVLASPPAGATSVPAVSTLGLVLGSLGLGVLGAWRVRSRG